MAQRSTKLDKITEATQSSLDYSRKQIAGFNDDMTVIVRELAIDPYSYISGGNSRAAIGPDGELVTPAAEGSVNLAIRTVGESGKVTDIPYVDTLVDVLQRFTSILNTTQGLLTTTRTLLETLSSLAVGLDDAVYLLVKSLLSQIVDIVSLLSPRVGVSALVIPPSPPGSRLRTDSTDTQILERYAALSEDLRDLTNDPESLAVRDRGYFSKTYSTATSSEQLKTVVIASIDDKYDPNRPFASARVSLANQGHSAGVILTAAGSAGNALTIYKNWCKILGYQLPSDSRITKPSITDVSYRKNITDTGYSITVKFNIRSHKYLPHQPTKYIPIKYRVMLHQGDTLLEPYLSDYIWQLPLSTNSDLYSDTLSTLQGIFRFSTVVVEGDFNLPFFGNATDSAITNSYFNNLELSEIITTPLTGEYNIYVSVRSSDSTSNVDSTSVRKLLVEPKKSSAGKAQPPNWYGGSLELPAIKYLDTKVNEIATLMKSLTERHVSNYLDAGIKVIQDYIDLVLRLRTALSDLIATLELIASFRVGGYASIYRADSGVSGLKKAVEEHFSTMDPHVGDTMTALVIVGESDVVSDLDLLMNTLSMIFGVELATTTETLTCSSIQSGSGSTPFSTPAEEIGGLPPELTC